MLLILSVILVVSTILPGINVVQLFLLLTAVMIAGLMIAIVINIRARRALPPDPRMTEERETWRMPSLALLNQPVKSRGRLIALCTVRGYAIVAMVSLLIKTSPCVPRQQLAHPANVVAGCTLRISATTFTGSTQRNMDGGERPQSLQLAGLPT